MHRFPIGTKFTKRNGRAVRECTVIDQLTTTNAAGEVVRERYVASHPFLGQTLTDVDVCDTTIARGLLPEFQHLLTSGER